jgi:hypothetical protein
LTFLMQVWYQRKRLDKLENKRVKRPALAGIRNLPAEYRQEESACTPGITALSMKEWKMSRQALIKGSTHGTKLYSDQSLL